MGVRFGSVEIDDAKRELRRHGQVAEVEPKVFDLLGYLIQHRNRVVPKAELLDQFWPDPNVGEGALTNCIVRVRTALGGDGDQLRTFHRRGYQFVAPVVVTAHPEETTAQVGGPDTVPTALVGRAGEWARLQRAVAALGDGSGRVILLSGESGIGKTRLAEEAVRYARSVGVEVLIARCIEGAAHFAPWQEIVESYVEGRPDAIEETMGTVLATIAQVVPSLHAAAVSALPAGETARSRLFDALASFVSRAAAIHPLMLFFDDLQWADGTSLALMQFVARAVSDAGVLMLLSYRDDETLEDHPVHSMTTALRRLPDCENLVLKRMTDSDSRALLARLADGGISAEVSQVVIDSADGNPFFIGESWRYLLQEDLVHREGGRWVNRLDAAPIGLTGAVQAIIQRRLNRLTPECRKMLEVAAVLGREFAFDALEEVCQDEGEAFIDALDEAARTQVIVRQRHAKAAYRFSHSLIRDELYRNLSTETRHALHCRIGESIERRAAEDVESHLAELAGHFLQCADAGQAEKAAAYAQRAGEQAYADMAYEEAIGQLRRALAVVERHWPDRIARRYDLLVALADAYLGCGASELAAHTLQKLNDLVNEGSVVGLPRERGTMTRHERLLTAFTFVLNLAQVPDQIGTSLDQPWNDRLAHYAVERARRTGNPIDLVSALENRRRRLWGPAHVRERLSVTNEWHRVALQIGDVDVLQEARLHRIGDLLESNCRDEADAEITAYSTLAETYREFRWPALYLQAMRAHLDGRFEESERLADEALQVGIQSIPLVAQAVHFVQISSIRAAQGRIAERLALTEALVESLPAAASMRAVLAGTYCDLGRLEEARPHYQRLAADDFASLALSTPAGAVTWMGVIAPLARVCTELGDRVGAQRLYEQMLPCASTFMAFGLGMICLGATAGYLAGLAVTAGRWKEAVGHFEQAYQINTQMRAWPAVAHLKLQHARVLLQRGGVQNRRAARGLLDAALEIARDLEMHGVVERIEAVRRG